MPRMPWRGHAAIVCKGCDRHVDECGPLSARYLCAECGERRMIENRRDLQSLSGPYFHHFRRRLVASFGGVLVDELEEDE